MKPSLILTAAAALVLWGCSGPSSLSHKIAGAWSSNPERFFDTDNSSATIVETYSFTPGGADADSGAVAITALVSVTGAVGATDGIIQPVGVTASGYATVEGTWRATGASQLELKLNENTLSVNVDPDAVVINTDALDGAQEPATVATLRPALAQSIAAELRRAVAARYPSAMTLSSVSFKNSGTVLRFKTGRASAPVTLTRQPG